MESNQHRVTSTGNTVEGLEETHLLEQFLVLPMYWTYMPPLLPRKDTEVYWALFWVTPRSAQGLLQALSSGAMVVPGMKPRADACKECPIHCTPALAKAPPNSKFQGFPGQLLCLSITPTNEHPTAQPLKLQAAPAANQK